MSPDKDRAPVHEIAPLAARMDYMQMLRGAIAAIALLAAALAPEIAGAQPGDLLLVTLSYLGLSLTAETIRRVAKARGLAIVTAMLLVDGLFLGWIGYLTGGPQSALRFLVFVHIIAATLLASHRTGLKMALWHSLLTFVLLYAQVARFIEPTGSSFDLSGPGTSQFERLSIFNVTAFWIVALSTAAFSALNERELRRRQMELAALTKMATELETQRDPASIAQVFLDNVGAVFEFRRAVVLEISKGSSSLLAFRGSSPPVEMQPGIDPMLMQAMRSHEPTLIKDLDAETDPRVSSLMPGAKHVVLVPLFAEGHPLGVMVGEIGVSKGRIERRVLSMLMQFASHSALALRNAWLLEQVQRLAETDALTQVANRRLFETTLARELSRAARSGENVSLIMLDVDHFKLFNDAHGHQAGDDVLRKVAHALSITSREFDTVARYGGEEFAVVLPRCSIEEAEHAAERLREAVFEIPAVASVTASAGLATFPIHAADATSLVRAADGALYASKRSGRDRVTTSQLVVTVESPGPVSV